MKEFVTSDDNRHMPLRGLALHAQRIGKVFGHVSTWARVIRDYGWRRPRLRVHPGGPTVGVRSTRPGELVHIDVSEIAPTTLAAGGPFGADGLDFVGAASEQVPG